MTRKIALEDVLRRSDSCYVPLIRGRIADGDRPFSRAELVGEGHPLVARVSWPEPTTHPALLLRLDRAPEVRS